MTPVLTTFADSSSGLGALGVDGRAFIIQLITFVLALLVLKRYAFGPILRIMRERREMIESGVKLGEQMQKEKAELEQQVSDALHDARKQADAIVSEAQESGRQVVREAEEKAAAKADGIMQEAKSKIAQDTAQARQKLEAELVGLVADTTEAVISEKLDTKKDAELIERSLKQQKVSA